MIINIFAINEINKCLCGLDAILLCLYSEYIRNQYQDLLLCGINGKLPRRQ